ncbi:MAG: substrate-binding domain-containing protein [Planctomycetota bacterium]
MDYVSLGDRRKTIVLGLDPRDPYHRSIIEGVLEYARGQDDWDLLVTPEPDALRAHLDDGHAVSGIILFDPWQKSLTQGLPAETPVVLTLCAEAPPDHDGVSDDEAAIADMVVAYFREMGLERLAFLDHLAPPSERRLAFASSASQAGLECHAYPPVGEPAPLNWHDRTEAIGDWLERLAARPETVGVFCFHVGEAQQLSIACRKRGIAVPERISILSCGGDDIECHLASPPLSTIDQGGDRLGFAAASRLAERLDGDDPPPRFVRFAPVGVVRRQSSDLLAVEDPHVAQAIRLIRQQAADGASVTDITAQVPVSRRRLDYAFERTVGRSIHQQIVHERLSHAKRLLLRTNLPLTDIAMRCGFNYPTRMSEAFRRHLAMTPSEYRRQNRTSAMSA